MIKNQTTTRKILIITLLLSLFILLTSISGVHASSTVYVNATGGNDSNDGSINHPYKTIDQAIKNVDKNGIVKIANGIYKGKGNTNLTISKNMKIIGQHQKKTIINGEGTNWIFTVNRGVNVTIMNLTLTNGTSKNGGAIYNQGTCNVSGCTFTGNRATSNSAGGAICNYGNCTVEVCTFNSNTVINHGGAIYSYGNLTVNACIFIDNKADHDGGAILSQGNLNVSGSKFIGNTACNGSGGAIDIFGGTLNVNSCTFTNNTAWGGGAIQTSSDNAILSGCMFIGNAATVYGGAISNYGTINCLSGCTFVGNTATDGGAIRNGGDIADLNGCTFVGNKATLGGAIHNWFSNLTAHFNRFVNNTAANGNAIYCNSGSVDVRYNWWGSNTSPKNVSNLIAGQADKVDTDSWLVLTITPQKSSIDVNSKTTVTVDLLHDSNGVYHDPANGHVPNGAVVTFSASNGTLNPLTAELINGSATTTLTAHNECKSIIQATIDNQTVSTEVTVNPVKPIPIDPVKPTPVKPDTPNSNDNGTQHNTVHAASTVGLQKTGMPLNYLLLGLMMVFGALGLRRK